MTLGSPAPRATPFELGWAASAACGLALLFALADNVGSVAGASPCAAALCAATSTASASAPIAGSAA